MAEYINDVMSKFDSRAEKLVNSILPKYINTEYYSISTHVNLDRIFSNLQLVRNFKKEYEHYCDIMERPDMKNIRFDKMHFDFVIYENNHDFPVLILEVNGTKHIEIETKQFIDKFKNHIANKHNLPLRTLELYISYSDNKIENILKETLTNAALPGIFPAYCKCGKRLLYKCFGEYPQKVQYYQCPACKKSNGKFLTYNISDIPNLLVISSTPHVTKKSNCASNSTNSQNKNTKHVKGKLYLNVPYNEKDEVYTLGAKFDGNIKKWYYEGNIYNYPQFTKWILNETPKALIAYDYLYILDGKHRCPKCRKDTTVISLGIGEHITINKNSDESIDLEFEDYQEGSDLIHMAWTSNEEEIPSKLLQYLKSHYSARTVFTLDNNEYFTNCCEHCNTPLSNNIIFDKTEGPFGNLISNKTVLSKKISQVTVKTIPIDSNLQLNWDITFNDNDDAYLKYGQKTYLNLRTNREVHSITDDDYITYQELYEL